MRCFRSDKRCICCQLQERICQDVKATVTPIRLHVQQDSTSVL